MDEIRHFCPGVPWLLIGTRIDLRAAKDPKAYKKWNQPIATKEGRAAAKRLGASAYIECSAFEQVNVNEVFEQVSNRIFNCVSIPVHSLKFCRPLLPRKLQRIEEIGGSRVSFFENNGARDRRGC